MVPATTWAPTMPFTALVGPLTVRQLPFTDTPPVAGVGVPSGWIRRTPPNRVLGRVPCLIGTSPQTVAWLVPVSLDTLVRSQASENPSIMLSALLLAAPVVLPPAAAPSLAPPPVSTMRTTL